MFASFKLSVPLASRFMPANSRPKPSSSRRGPAGSRRMKPVASSWPCRTRPFAASSWARCSTSPARSCPSARQRGRPFSETASSGGVPVPVSSTRAGPTPTFSVPVARRLAPVSALSPGRLVTCTLEVVARVASATVTAVPGCRSSVLRVRSVRGRTRPCTLSICSSGAPDMNWSRVMPSVPTLALPVSSRPFSARVESTRVGTRPTPSTVACALTAKPARLLPVSRPPPLHSPLVWERSAVTNTCPP